MGNLAESTVWLFSPLFPVRIEIWKCWFLWKEENWSTRRKTLGAETRTNNKLNPHIAPSPGIEPGPHWWEASALITALVLLPCFSLAWKGNELMLRVSKALKARFHTDVGDIFLKVLV